MEIKEVIVGKYEGKEIISYSIKNKNAIEVKILNFGAIITDIITPDKNFNMGNIVLKYDDINSYIENPSYLGGFIGRTSGRIYNSEVTMDKDKIKFSNNYNPHQGHGGEIGFNKRFYNVTQGEEDEYAYLELSRVSFSNEECYPGNLNVKVRYTLNNNNELEIRYYGKSDEDTLVNLTNHSYFNLSGNAKRDILDQYLYVNSKEVLELDDTQGVTGKILNIENTELDFLEIKKIGKDINGGNKQLKIGKGYDNPWILQDNENISLKMYDEESGRGLEVKTDRECLILYTHNYPDDKKLENGISGQWRYGLAIEPQNHPIGKDSVFVDKSILRKDEEYVSKTIYKFL